MTFNSYTLRRILVGVLVGLGLVGCATPVAPTGGPRDTTPPFVIGSIPEANTVNFSGDRVTLEFSEKVDRASFQRALSITPRLPIPPELEWHGRRVEIVFRDLLRDSTTYIVEVDNQFQDIRGVKLDRPLSFAFATGATIDEGTIRGRVADPASDEPIEGIDVLAFEADSAGWTMKLVPGVVADYRTQTGSDGTFVFGNLPRRSFFIVGLEDRNRNLTVDSLEAFALPAWGAQLPDTSSADLDPTGAASDPRPQASWYLDRKDITPPQVLQIQSINSRLSEIRFSEPVMLDSLTPARWAIGDTAGSKVFEARALYQPPSERNRVVAVTDSLPIGTYTLVRAAAVRDSAGNRLDEAGLVGSSEFTASMRADTMTSRFLGFGPRATVEGGPIEIAAGRIPWIQFSAFVELSRRREIVSAQDQSGAARETMYDSRDGTRWMLNFDPPAYPGDTITVSVLGSPAVDSIYSERFVILTDEQTGSVTGVIRGNGPAKVELFSVTGHSNVLATDLNEEGSYRFGRLLKGSYRVRAFVDRNGDSKWTSGSLDPPRPPEQLIWHRAPIDVRKGWESAVDTLEFRKISTSEVN